MIEWKLGKLRFSFCRESCLFLVKTECKPSSSLVDLVCIGVHFILFTYLLRVERPFQSYLKVFISKQEALDKILLFLFHSLRLSSVLELHWF